MLRETFSSTTRRAPDVTLRRALGRDAAVILSPPRVYSRVRRVRARACRHQRARNDDARCVGVVDDDDVDDVGDDVRCAALNVNSVRVVRAPIRVERGGTAARGERRCAHGFRQRARRARTHRHPVP